MQIEATAAMSTAQQLRPVVITVITAKLAVFALLMTTINFQAPDFQAPDFQASGFQATMPATVEIAAVR